MPEHDLSANAPYTPATAPMSPMASGEGETVLVEAAFDADAEQSLARTVARALAGDFSTQRDIGELLDWLEAHTEELVVSGMAFAAARDGRANRRALVAEEMPPGDTWFIGDLHGDLLALEASLLHVERTSSERTPTIVFLGDMFDRGPFGAEVLLRIAGLAKQRPGQVLVLAGNHDDALQHDAAGQIFSSRCAPAEFADWINARVQSGDPHAARLGRWAVRFVALLPRFLALPDGLLVAHAGIPQRDLWPGALAAREDLERPDAMRDFIWCRPTTAKRKDPYRGGSDGEFGWGDFQDFCAFLTESPLGIRAERMLTGHEHPAERWQRWRRYTPKPLVTICTMSWRAGEFFGPYHRQPCIARWRQGALPEVHRLMLSESLVCHDAVRRAYDPAAFATDLVAPPAGEPAAGT